MDFASRITRRPLPFEPERGREARAHVPGLGDALGQVVEGAAGCSPFLAGLVAREADWLGPAFDDPEAALDAECARAAAAGQEAIGAELRRAKRRVALLVALADLAGVWPLEEVTGRLTRFADIAVEAAIRAALAPEIRRGRLPGAGPGDLDTAAGWVALAMGKMGAGELNYSSDIDLICLFDDSRFAADDFHAARSVFVKATRRMTALLSDMTEEGYVFRTDLRLRPDPSVTPVCVAMEAAERYYESLGRTWERAAYVKARPCAGDLAAGERFLEALTPFVWRRHLDYAAIRDAHEMRLRIRAHKLRPRADAPEGAALQGRDLKLGRGGIREIEFFTQTQQIIAGGRDPDLRVRGTVEGLAVLARKGWIPDATAKTLTGHYRALREIEHRLQMVSDAQTHALPRSAEGMARIAAMMGMEVAPFEAGLRARLEEIHALTEEFFSGEAGRASAGKAGGYAVGGAGAKAGASAAEDIEDLAEPEREIVGRWPTYAALRSARAVEIFGRLRPAILRRLRATAHPGAALIAFDEFLRGLPAGVQLFSLIEANPHLLDLLADIVGTAPALARHLARNPQVLDAVIGGDFFAPWPGRAPLAEELRGKLDREADYERRLDMARRWGKEWRFRVGVHHLRGLIGAEEAGAQYADIAEAALRAVLPHVIDQFAAKHGRPPGRGACVLGMGSLGARRLNAVSDLDLIVIYDGGDAEASDGRRPLAVRPYYARLTQALITAVSAPTAEGRLYAVDMRLRPSGHQGPVATSWAAFQEYQRGEAWVWEHLAMTRARVVAGDAGLGADVETFRLALLGEKGRDRARVLAGLADMRARIASAKAPEGPWDAKCGPGRLQDVELVAQAGALIAGVGARSVRAGLGGAVRAGWLDDAARAALQASYDLCWEVHAISKLLSEAPLSDADLVGGGAAMILRETGFETIAALRNGLAERAAAAAAVIDAALAGVTQSVDATPDAGRGGGT